MPTIWAWTAGRLQHRFKAGYTASSPRGRISAKPRHSRARSAATFSGAWFCPLVNCSLPPAALKRLLRRIEAELRRRGVDRGTTETAARLSDDELRSALTTALRRAQIRAPDGWWRLHERRARMVSSLIARGFEADDAIRAVDRLAANRENDHHGIDDESGHP